ncbi:MAG: hypothetical protein H6834_10985 [Planctomycetes bacterium]|nr:hypothetical protein [Planctomycetota bacterium]MCB9891739.1 hypothetical protein [Planctomycetota bacterium]
MTRPRWATLVLLILLVGALAHAAVIRRSLEQMVTTSPSVATRADSAVLGEIVAVRSFVRDLDEGPLEFTEVTVKGVSLFDGFERTETAAFVGGPHLIASTMPPLSMTRVGNRVVMFSGFCRGMGGGDGMNSIVCGFGGLYQVVANAAGEDVVIGQGVGAAIEETQTIDMLRQRIDTIRNR